MPVADSLRIAVLEPVHTVAAAGVGQRCSRRTVVAVLDSHIADIYETLALQLKRTWSIRSNELTAVVPEAALHSLLADCRT